MPVEELLTYGSDDIFKEIEISQLAEFYKRSSLELDNFKQDTHAKFSLSEQEIHQKFVKLLELRL